MPILALVLLCAIFYAGFEVFAALADGKVDNWLAAVLYNGIGTAIPLIVYFAISAKGKTTWKGIVFASLAGVAIMLFSVVLANIFNRGGNLTYVIPVIYGTAIVLSSVFGFLILKEKVSVMQLIGLVVVVIGVAIIAMSKYKTI